MSVSTSISDATPYAALQACRVNAVTEMGRKAGSPPGDDTYAVPEREAQDIHPGIRSHVLIEGPDGVRHFILNPCCVVCSALQYTEEEHPQDASQSSVSHKQQS